MTPEWIPAAHLVEILIREGHRIARTRDGEVVISPEVELAPHQRKMVGLATWSPGHVLYVCSACGKEMLVKKGAAKRKCKLTPHCPGKQAKPSKDEIDLYHQLLRRHCGPL